MKIIGLTNTGYLLTATKAEVSNFIGYYWEGDDGHPVLGAGHEIQVGKMYGRLRDLARAEEEMDKKAKELRRIADLLEPLCPLLPVEDGENEETS